MNAIWSFRRQLLSCFVSRRSFSKGWTTITLQKLLFFLLSFFLLFSQEKQNMNATKWLWILFFNKFRKKKKNLFFGERFWRGFFPPYYTANATATHVAQTANLYPKLHAWTPVHIHCHTRHPDGTGEFYRQILHVSHSVQRNQAPCFYS